MYKKIVRVKLLQENFFENANSELTVDLRFKVRLPAASIGAKCFSVVSLHKFPMFMRVCGCFQP